MKNILLCVSYDGTDFCGWQRQDGAQEVAARTVQGVLEKALFRLHKAKTPVCGSGRTDSGVHALSQAVSFISPIDSIPIDHYPRAINSFLPSDVHVTAARLVPKGFSARFSATSRVYRYFISTDDVPPAILPRYAWCIHRDVNVERLNAFAKEVRGEVDCTSFAASSPRLYHLASQGTQSLYTMDAPCSTRLLRELKPPRNDDGLSIDGSGNGQDEGQKMPSPFRYIENMRFFTQEAFPRGRLVVFEIEANAYLYHMVRNLVGTLLLLEKQSAAAGSLAAIANAHDRRKAGPTAPAQGLFLWEVKFDGVRRGS